MSASKTPPEMTCKLCGKLFALAAGEIRFFQTHGLQLPKKCKECRSLAREDLATPKSMQKTFFNSTGSHIPTVPWRHV
jgi:hypothetical protein